jgi:DNA helicase-2/ATP-dependent DNA helicase PcrA
VQVHAAWDSEEEARAVGEEIEQAQRRGHALNDMAILVRASFQMREFEDRFVTLGLNYRVIGGPRFYERMEIRDAMAYLRVVASPPTTSPSSASSTRRSAASAKRRCACPRFARARGMPMLEAAGELVQTEEMKPKPRAALRELVENVHPLAAIYLKRRRIHELAEIILEESGYTAMWQNDRSADAPGRLENLKELVRSMEEFESLRAFLEHVSLVMDTEQNEIWTPSRS